MSFDIFSSAAACISRTFSRIVARRFAFAIGLAAFAAMLFAGVGSNMANTTAIWSGTTSGDIGDATNYNGSPTLGPTVDLQFFGQAETNAPSTDSVAPLSVGELIFTNTVDPGSAVTIGALAA